MSSSRKSPVAAPLAMAAVVVLLAALCACGFRPIYATDGSAAPGAPRHLSSRTPSARV